MPWLLMEDEAKGSEGVLLVEEKTLETKKVDLEVIDYRGLL